MAGFRGERNGNARLTEADVRHIRWMLDTKQSNAVEIARMRGLNAETVRRIGRRETWAWVAEAPSEPQMQEGAMASYRKLLADNPDIKVERAVPEAPAVSRIAQEIAKAKEKERAGDKMLDELSKGEASGTTNSSK